MKRTPRVGSTPKRVPPAASSSRVDTEKHDEPLVGKRKGMGKTWNMKRKLYLPQTRDQPDMRAMRVAKAATRGRPGGWGRGGSLGPSIAQRRKPRQHAPEINNHRGWNMLELPQKKMQKCNRKGDQSVTSQRGGGANHLATKSLLPRLAPRGRAGRAKFHQIFAEKSQISSKNENEK